MIKLNTVLILTFLLTCCTPKKSGTDSPERQQLLIVLADKNIEKSYGNCESDTSAFCTKVAINYPQFSGDSVVAHKINSELENEFLRNILQDSAVDASFTSYANQFIEDYKVIEEEFGQAFGWYLELESNIIRHDTTVLVLENSLSTFTGGAHGNNSIHYLNFKVKTGERLTLNDVVATGNRGKLNQLAKKHFEQTYLKNADDSTHSYQFEDDQYYNDNFALLNSGIKFYYNSYEIAPYAVGPSEIVIPFEELHGIVKSWVVAF